MVNVLDMDAIYASSNEKDGRGMSAYASPVVVRALLCGYCVFDSALYRMQDAKWIFLKEKATWQHRFRRIAIGEPL